MSDTNWLTLATGKPANKRSVKVSRARAEELKTRALATWSDCGAEVHQETSAEFRVYYWREGVDDTPRKDAAVGQEWEVKVSGRVQVVRLDWIGYRPSSFEKVSRRKFTGVNVATNRQVAGDAARLRRRVK